MSRTSKSGRTPSRSTETSAPREAGAHYTPNELAAQFVREALEIALSPLWDHRDILNLKVCDPACGDGALLGQCALQLAERLASTPKHRALDIGVEASFERIQAAEVLHGNELRADAAASARATLGCPIGEGDGLDWAFPSGPVTVIMNPPWLGRSKRAPEVTQRIRILTGSGAVDLAVAFLRRAAAVVEAQGGTVHAILPKACIEGDSRVAGLAALLAKGWRIVRAQRPRHWPGRAAVLFVIVHLVPPSNRRAFDIRLA